MSHLVLFDEARRALPEAYLDFAFLPSMADRKRLSKKGIPWFFGRASGRFCSAFDILLISCSFTLEVLNLPWLLSQDNIPYSRNERLRNLRIPLLLLGGSSAVTTGCLIERKQDFCDDSLVDALFFGEGEDKIGKIVQIAAQGKKEGKLKASILDEIAHTVEGFWPCDMHYSTRRALSPIRPAALTTPLVLNGDSADHVKLAITAGCIGHCAFASRAGIGGRSVKNHLRILQKKQSCLKNRAVPAT